MATFVFQVQQLRQASPDKSCPELRMRIGPLPPTPGQSSAASTGSSTSYWQQSSSPGSTGTSTTEATSPPPVAPPRVESLAFSGLITGSEAAPPLPARNPDPAPAPPPRNPAGLPPVGGGGLPPPTPPAKLPRPVSHESLNSVASSSGHGHQRRGSHAAAHPYRASGGAGEQAAASPPSVDLPAGRGHVSHTRTRSSPVSLEQTLGE